MSTQAELDKVISSEYEAGFTTLVESDTLMIGSFFLRSQTTHRLEKVLARCESTNLSL